MLAVMPNVRHVRFRKTKAGALVRGTDSVSLDDFDLSMHMDRAVWLTSQLEAPSWGMVQSYDGAAMSGGLLHNIAVAPKTMTQSSLFGLLRRIEVMTRRCPPLTALWNALEQEGYYVARDGKLRSRATGHPVPGRTIRNLFTPNNGNVPAPTRRGKNQKWEQAKRWALRFHELLAHPATRPAQVAYAAEWMAKSRTALEMKGYGSHTTGLDSPIGLRAEALAHELDLAMCVYHSFSVNGPGPAARALTGALRSVGDTVHREDVGKFAASLVRRLGRSSYGKWREKRYPHTRRAVSKGVKAGLWPRSVANAIVPAKLWKL